MNQPLEVVSEYCDKTLKISDCSKAALLQTQKTNAGQGIICADEVSQFLGGMLKRSSSDTSGERQLLLTLWGGRGHTVAYASKQNIRLNSSGLCIGGFTQPDRMFEILEEMKSSGDGLFERFLIWMLPGYVYSGASIKAANTEFNSKYLLKSLAPVFQEIYNIHSANQITYGFSPEAQELVDQTEEKVRVGILNRSSAVVTDSSDEDIEDSEVEPINCIIGSKYMDQLGRLCLSMHIFSSVLEQILGRNSNIDIPQKIEVRVVEGAIKLLDHIMKQNDIVLNAMFPTSYEPMPDASGLSEISSSLDKEIMYRLMAEPGCVYPISNLTRYRHRGEVITAVLANEVVKVACDLGFGTLDKVKVGKTKRNVVFFKTLPDQINVEKLKSYGIDIAFYRQQFTLPISTCLRLDSTITSYHPQAHLLFVHNSNVSANDTVDFMSTSEDLNLQGESENDVQLESRSEDHTSEDAEPQSRSPKLVSTSNSSVENRSRLLLQPQIGTPLLDHVY
ncbi:hypothetical protein FSP39_015870 [Pinctada imbricata]|uniref:Uncharacterized protein n=1 Tax=Pinctada imbricata TaxID=66713 RepID=A0AA89BZ94_PINIB|nr:hypothetical protein FSP39_015870 [Pinctada imbricata]